MSFTVEIAVRLARKRPRRDEPVRVIPQKSPVISKEFIHGAPV
jgi:hypothetical protein